MPFTLAFEDDATVRVSAQNNVPVSNVPGAPAPLITYSRKRPVIDRVPLRAFDWGQAAFGRHHIKNVRLGPIQPTAGIGYEVGPLRSSTTGTFKPLRALAGARDPDGARITVQGRAAAKELTGWPWDVAYEAWYGEYLKPPSTNSAFQNAIIAELYGAPSIRAAGGGPWLWLYDLDGARLSAENGEDSSCLRTRQFWEGALLIGANGDLGPWGCSLVMMLLYRPHGGMVSSYGLEVVSGYVKAINHFLTRIEELEATREKIKLIESVDPKL